MKKLLSSTLPIALLLTLVLGMGACKKYEYNDLTTEDTNITGFLERTPENFSLLSQIIERSGSEGFLAAYGRYTLFAPTNDAINSWLKEKSFSSVEQVPVADLKKMIRFHLVIEDSLKTTDFIDGRLRYKTLYGQYLTTTAKFVGSTTSYFVNGNSKILSSNNSTGNGMIHVIDRVLQPETKTLAQLITTAEGDKYSYFAKALEQTGLYQYLNYLPEANPDTTKMLQTVFVETDAAIKNASANYDTYEKFRAEISDNKTDYTDPGNGLYKYVAYHILPQINYYSDLLSQSSIATLVPKQVIQAKSLGSGIVFNEIEFDGKVEEGFNINRQFADITAANGVLHEVNSFFNVKVRVPTALYWDVMNQDNIRNQSWYRSGSQAGVRLTPDNISVTPNIVYERPQAGQFPRYVYNTGLTNNFGSGAAGLRYYNLNDGFFVSLTPQVGRNNARNIWFQMKTPLLVEGRYKVWICYGANTTSQAVQVIMNPGTPDEQALPYLVNTRETLENIGESMTNPNVDANLLEKGYKRYMAINSDKILDPVTGAVIKSGDVPDIHAGMVGRFVGYATIKNTDTQWIKFLNVGTANGENNFNIDMIHFVPDSTPSTEEYYPRFSKDGTQFKKNR